MLILDGKVIATKLQTELATQVANLKIHPRLLIIQVGDLKVSNRYVAIKTKIAPAIGISTTLIKVSRQIDEAKLKRIIILKSQDFDGIILQLPLPTHLNVDSINTVIKPSQDVDAMTPSSLFTSPVVLAVDELLKAYNISLLNRKIAVIGQSRWVGVPIADYFSQWAQVSRYDKVTGLNGVEKAEIVISAVGEAGLIKREHLLPQAVVVDVGINFTAHNGLTGDVDPTGLAEHIAALSPVPGGVGPLTVMTLFSNVVKAALIKRNSTVRQDLS